MKRHRLIVLASLSSLYLSNVHAAAFQFYELGAPIIGTAGVGQASVASDASTAYFNSAGMTALNGTQIMFGSQLALDRTTFSINNGTTIAGNNGGQAGIFAPGLGLYYVASLMPKLKFGVSLNSPYGGALQYYDHWVGRYNVQQMTFYALNMNPSLAYQFTDWLALGAGIAVEYANLNQTVALPLIEGIDGQMHLKMSNTSLGYNLAALVNSNKGTKVGVAFRSQITHNLSGNADFLNISRQPVTSTKLVMPASIIASISQAITNQFTLLGEVGWANWSSMQDVIVNIGSVTAVTPQDWNNTYRLGVGGQYTFLSQLMWQAGISYDSSPTSASKRLPELPVDKQIRVGTGIQYPLAKVVMLGLSYEYIDLGSADINNVSRIGVIDGYYGQNYTNVVQLSINVAC